MLGSFFNIFQKTRQTFLFTVFFYLLNKISLDLLACGLNEFRIAELYLLYLLEGGESLVERGHLCGAIKDMSGLIPPRRVATLQLITKIFLLIL